MDDKKDYLYTYAVSLRNSRRYWKYLVSYVFSIVLLFQLTATFYGFSITGIIVYIIYIILLWTLSIGLTVIFLLKFLKENRLIHWNIFDKAENKTSNLETLDENVNELSENIEKQFIDSWYHEISQDGTFSNESRLAAKSTIRSLIKIMRTMDQVKLSYTTCNIFLKHIKEFRRSIRRKESVANKGKILQLYRYSHSSMSTKKSQEYFIHEITKSVLASYIHWELWNSLPCQIVVGIVSKQLSEFLLNYLSRPELINYYLLTMLLNEKQKTDLNLKDYTFVNIVQYQNLSKMDDTDLCIKIDAPTNISLASCAESTKNEKVYPDEIEKEVKIYEAKSATKRWTESSKFDANISVGEDPLSSESLEMTELSKDFKKDLWASGDATVTTLNNIKDFQENTVNTVVKHKHQVSQATTQALHKIGDLQDEAAGMVEGLFDFGMAGIRKGLKLTGLQENVSDDQIETKIKKLEPVLTKPRETLIEGDTVWVNPLDCDPNFIIATPSSEDFEDHRVPSILLDQESSGSPDPEYEETADLATTIAKLRSLLQQKSESTSTTPMISPMPEEGKNVLELDEIDGVVPSFYKFCAKTATGVFNNTLNTLKTALPVNANEILSYDEETKWDYLEGDEKAPNMHTRLIKLLNERKDFGMVEPAFDALDSQPIYDSISQKLSETSLFDELDEIELKIPLAITLVDIFCELVSDSNAVITREPIIKSILLIFGEKVDQMVLKLVDLFLDHVLSITDIPMVTSSKTLDLELDTFVELLASCVPEYLKLFSGQTTTRQAFTLLISSLQIEQCNQDVILQILEFIALKLIEDSSKLTPPYST